MGDLSAISGFVMASARHRIFDDIVAVAIPALRPVCRSLRRQIAALDKNYTEIIWFKQRIASFGVGPKKMSEHYAYIAVHATHVNLGFYHGAALTDRARLLKGAGKKLRYISFTNVASTRKPAVTSLLRQAIADRVRVSVAGARLGDRPARAATSTAS